MTDDEADDVDQDESNEWELDEAIESPTQLNRELYDFNEEDFDDDFDDDFEEAVEGEYMLDGGQYSDTLEGSADAGGEDLADELDFDSDD